MSNMDPSSSPDLTHSTRKSKQAQQTRLLLAVTAAMWFLAVIVGIILHRGMFTYAEGGNGPSLCKTAILYTILTTLGALESQVSALNNRALPAHVENHLVASL